MTSPPAQPTIADAVRLMDSLDILAGPSKALSVGPAAQLSLPPATCTPVDAVRPPHRHSTLDSHAEHPYPQPRRSINSTGPPSSEHASNSTRIPPLPAEIIYQIGTHLVHPTGATNSHQLGTCFPCAHANASYTPLCTLTTPLPSTLVALSSASVAFRNTLAPLIWHTVVIKTPQHLPRLAALLSNYDTLSTRSSSPSATRRNSSPTSPSSTTSELEPTSRSSDVGLRHPLPNLKSIVVSIPDKYPDLDQSFLISLLRSMSLAQTHQLQHLYWSAEAAPHPAIWTLVGPSLRSLEVDGRTFYHGHKGWAGLERLESLRLVGYESTLLPGGVVALLQGQRGVNGGDKGKMLVREVPEGMMENEAMARGRRLSPVMQLQHSATVSPRRVAQHLYLDHPLALSPTSPPTLPSFASPHTSNTSQRRSQLRHLSLSSSKTSILHQPALITSSSFSTLTCLDIYAVTPEPPLSHALISASSTLTHLRLVLDISGAFANFNALWSDLTGKLPHLTWLEVDPMPQQNTAPSFWDFVERCERLEWINGRRVDTFPPCFGGFDPAHPSGALPF
ncbi:uncharacterized protein UTRI_00548_B [Ustilago trichophora]|uniref:Uncharacterized protein n=1 Tax=Ustilago trichophora TaxID=86804 RepID=A0A5C3DQ02_9BASI|nr:uncharacterized protein UTRI_00548_B [Ustilago trichophora]